MRRISTNLLYSFDANDIVWHVLSNSSDGLLQSETPWSLYGPGDRFLLRTHKLRFAHILSFALGLLAFLLAWFSTSLGVFQTSLKWWTTNSKSITIYIQSLGKPFSIKINSEKEILARLDTNPSCAKVGDLFKTSWKLLCHLIDLELF